MRQLRLNYLYSTRTFHVYEYRDIYELVCKLWIPYRQWIGNDANGKPIWRMIPVPEELDMHFELEERPTKAMPTTTGA